MDISKHVNNLDEYHKKVIDKNDTTSQRIEEIFTNVKNIDIRYQNGLGQELSYANSITDMIKVLSDTIDPNGGNMNLQKMNEALAASLEKIRENQLSKNKVIEDSMLGTDPDAAEMSADPVNLSTGNFVYDHQDLIVGGEIPLVFHRYYNSKDTRVGRGGAGRQERQVGDVLQLDEGVGERHLTGQDVGDTFQIVSGLQIAVKDRLAEVAVHEDDLFAAFRQSQRQIDRHIGLCLFRDRAGDDESVDIAGTGQKVQVGAQSFVSFNVGKRHTLLGDELKRTLACRRVGDGVSVERIPHGITPPG